MNIREAAQEYGGLTVRELNRDQLNQLKESLVILKSMETLKSVGINELMYSCDLITDEEVYEYYEGVLFSEEDFYSQRVYFLHNGNLFITDDCYVDIGNGETLQELYRNGMVLFNGGKIIMIGFIVGLIIGILGGGTVMALCVVASDSDRKMEEIMKNIK